MDRYMLELRNVKIGYLKIVNICMSAVSDRVDDSDLFVCVASLKKQNYIMKYVYQQLYILV